MAVRQLADNCEACSEAHPEHCGVMEDIVEAEQGALADEAALRGLFQHFGAPWDDAIHPCFQFGMSCDDGLQLMIFPGWAQVEAALPKDIIGELNHVNTLVILDSPMDDLPGVVGDLPPVVFGLGGLKQFYVKGAAITGPWLMSECGGLEMISLQALGLSGEIPANICLCRDLEELQLESTTLISGTLPSCLADLEHIKKLDLKFTSLSGTLPAFWQWLDLTDLQVGGTRLHGTLPDRFAELGSLEELDFDDTALSGGIPLSLAAKIPQLQDVRLSPRIFGCEAGEQAPSRETYLVGDVACRQCPIGRKQPLSDVGRCDECLPGRFTNESGKLECTECPVSSYASDLGATACDACPRGRAAPLGAVSETQCLEPPNASLIVALCVSGALLLLMLVVIIFGGKRLQKAKQKLRDSRRAHMLACLKRVNELAFPLIVMALEHFVTLGHMITLEEAGNRCLTVALVGVPMLSHWLLEEGHFIIFVSHQWLGWKQPDPEGVHYQAIARGTRAVARKLGLKSSKVDIWLDYHSIPQAERASQAAAIDCLAVYASVASAFLIVTVPTRHADTGLECNDETYKKRAWCRLEQFAHFGRRGVQDMYMYNAAGDDDLVLSVPQDWLAEIVFVFEGDCTCCRLGHKGSNRCDKEIMRDLIFGLYVEMLAGSDLPQNLGIQWQRSAPKQLRPSIEAPSIKLGTRSTTVHSQFMSMMHDGALKHKRLFGSMLKDAELFVEHGGDLSEHLKCQGVTVAREMDEHEV